MREDKRLVVGEAGMEVERDRKIYLTIDELLRLLPLAKATIYRYTSEGRIPHIKVGSRLMFKRSEIIAWLDGKHRGTQL